MSSLDLAKDLRRRSLSGATLLFTLLFGLGSLMGMVPLLSWTVPMAFFAPFMVFVGSLVANHLQRRGEIRLASTIFSTTVLVYVAGVMVIASPDIRLGIGFPLTLLVLLLVHLIHPTRQAARMGWLAVGAVALGLPGTLWRAELDWMVFTTGVVQLLVMIFGNLVLAFLSENWVSALADTDVARDQLAAALDDATSASHSKSAFLASMSHELRTPLNAILGYAEMLQEEVEDGILPDPADLQRIHTSGTLLLALVNQVLDLSKVESGRMELEMKTIEVQPILREVADTLRAQVESRGNTLVVELDPTPPLRVDPLRIRQVVTNLLSNAAKFTENGTVTLRMQHRADEDATIEVVDTGCGIPPERQHLVFEPFVQASESTSRTHGGTGLGLAIVRGLTTEMGGTLELDSEVGQGSTFRLAFAVATP